jgi:hypothetical protein
MAIKFESFRGTGGGAVTGGLVYKGSYDAATNTPVLTSAKKGNFYIVSVAGSLAGVTLNVGDHIVFNQDASNPITSAMFDVIDNTDAVSSVNTQTGVVVLDTDDIAEGGTNAYFTNARADARIAAATANDLSDVSYTAGAGIDGYVMKYSNTSGNWEAQAEAAGAVTSVNTQTGAVVLDSDDITEGTSNLYFTSPRFTAELATKDTDDLSEGATNLYYTNTRFDTQLATKDTDDLSEGATNLYYTNTRFDTQLATKDTDDISEGATNQYFTNARADARIAAATANDLSDVSYTAGAGIDGYVMTYNNTSGNWEAQVAASAPVTSVNTQTGAVVLDSDDITEGTTNLYYTNSRFDTQLATKDTDDLSEGATNQYFTNARADARIAAATANDLSDVSYTAGAGIDGYVMKYNNTSGNWEAQAEAAGAVTSVNTQTGAVVLDSDDIAEGATNLYYTNARFDTQLATKDTDDLSEGATNLYYTNARFDTQLATKDTDDLSEGATNQYFTNARADARIAAATANDLSDVSYTAGAGIDGYVLTYSNTNSQWEAQAAGGGAVGTLQQVTDQGATTTTNISVAQVTMGGDLLADGDQTRTIGSETNRFVTTHGDLNGAVRFKAKANVALSKGDVVYIAGVSGGVPTVEKAQANSASTMPAFGVCYDAASLNAEVQIVTFGNLEGINTGSFAVGDTLFVSETTAGALSNSAPAGESNLIQNIGRVVKVDGTGNSGIYKIGGAGRTNATPNLDTDKIFLGNGSNQAVSTALSSINLSSFNNNLDTDDITEGATNLYYTNARFDTQLATKDTDDISEGATNQYFTNARADARIAAATANDLSDVSYTAGAGIDGYVLTYSNTNSQWEAQAASGGGGGFTYTAITSASSPVSGAASTHYSADTSGGAITINLPALSGVTAGTEIRVKLKTAGNTLTLDGNLSETIDGSITYTLTVQNQAVTLVSDGSSNWEVI